MARAPVYVKTTSGQYSEAGTLIWGDVNLQASEFADSSRPHRNPLAGDPDYNSLRADYISSSDSSAQTIASALGIAPSSAVVPLTLTSFGGTDLLDLKIASNAAPPSGASSGFIKFDLTSKRVNNTAINGIFFAGSLDLNGIVGNIVTGLNFTPNLTNTGAGIGAGTSFVAIQTLPSLPSPTNASALSTVDAVRAISPNVNSGWTLTLRRSLVAAPGNNGGTITTDIGLDVASPSQATNNIAIRQTGTTGTNRLSAKSRFGDQIVPTANVDVLANAGAALKVGGKNALVVEILDENQASATVPNTDTALKSYVLPANQYSHVIVEGEGYVGVAIGATQQDLNIKIRDGGVQVGNTVLYNPPIVTAAEKAPFSIKASFVDQIGATLDISIGAAAADANTTVFLNSLRVYGEV